MKEIKTLDTLIRNRTEERLREEVRAAFDKLRQLRSETHGLIHFEADCWDENDSYVKPSGRVRVNNELFEAIAEAIVKELAPGRGNDAVKAFLEDAENMRAQLEALESEVRS